MDCRIREEQIKGNRKYQDTLFRFMFSDKESVIELYNALEGTNYDMDTEVEFTTLENVFYVEGKNDLGFSIAEKFVVLTEHQSTINGNMPLRFLNYVTHTYNKMIDNEELFKRKAIPILTPEFYVIYTGNEDWDKETLSLSDSFIGEIPENSMDLVVKIIDVRYNKKKAEAILARSEKLRGYSLLLNYVNTYRQEGHMLENAIDMAVNRCIDEHVLSDFLTQYGKEVRGMLYDDISIEDFAQIRGEERWEDGRQYGCEEMQNRINQLNALLIEEERIEDLKKSTEDKNYQEDLLKEYQLNRK
ncbi:MAG: Rpn family recombination-promoting nuclease/putative transposase [Firmicutes bacterium]|nr:Rpn family recombination-promoting nuclease/putative transposase [Bacillota bacterium]